MVHISYFLRKNTKFVGYNSIAFYMQLHLWQFLVVFFVVVDFFSGTNVDTKS